MNWEGAVDELNEIVTDVFGEPISLVHADIPTASYGIFWAPNSPVNVGGITIDSPDPSIEIDTDVLVSAGIINGDRVVVRGKTLTIVAIKHADDGTSLLTLRGYT